MFIIAVVQTGSYLGIRIILPTKACSNQMFKLLKLTVTIQMQQIPSLLFFLFLTFCYYGRVF